MALSQKHCWRKIRDYTHDLAHYPPLAPHHGHISPIYELIFRAGNRERRLDFDGWSPASQGGALTALTIIPSAQDLNLTGETAQFIAIGTFNSSPITRDMTDMVTWHSSDVLVATINSSGLATGVGTGPNSTTITAETTSTSGNTVTANATLTEKSNGGVTLPSLTASCTGNFVLGSSVTLTAVGSTFGGWSSNCTPSTSATCTVTMANNENVCAIFN